MKCPALRGNPTAHTVRVEATFVPGSEMLIGTQLLQPYRLEIHFPARTVLLDRVS